MCCKQTFFVNKPKNKDTYLVTASINEMVESCNLNHPDNIGTAIYWPNKPMKPNVVVNVVYWIVDHFNCFRKNKKRPLHLPWLKYWKEMQWNLLQLDWNIESVLDCRPFQLLFRKIKNKKKDYSTFLDWKIDINEIKKNKKINFLVSPESRCLLRLKKDWNKDSGIAID